MTSPSDALDAAAARTPNPTRRGWISALFVGLAVAALATVLGLSCVQADDKGAPVEAYEVVKKFPHDPRAFCQGLTVDKGELFEGTGLYGESTVRRVDLETGKVLASRPLHHEYFGEGIVVMGDEIYQLTWKNRVAIVYDRKTLNPLRSVRTVGEGWGATHDDAHIIISDGTDTLKFVEPKTFKTVRTVKVKDGRTPIKNLNELEFIDGEVWANVWYSDKIAKINPADGRVTGWVDCSALWPSNQRPNADAVLNGIAYDAEKGRIFVTGKNWPQVFEIRPPSEAK